MFVLARKLATEQQLTSRWEPTSRGKLPAGGRVSRSAGAGWPTAAQQPTPGNSRHRTLSINVAKQPCFPWCTPALSLGYRLTASPPHRLAVSFPLAEQICHGLSPPVLLHHDVAALSKKPSKKGGRKASKKVCVRCSRTPNRACLVSYGSIGRFVAVVLTPALSDTLQEQVISQAELIKLVPYLGAISVPGTAHAAYGMDGTGPSSPLCFVPARNACAGLVCPNPFAPLPAEHCLEELRAKAGKLGEDNDAGWKAEYNRFAAFEAEGQAARASMEHPNMNRYRNIVAYDHSRVKIEANQFNSNSDYINANYIHGYKQNRFFVAGQGPVPTSFNSFWQVRMRSPSPSSVAPLL